MFSKIPSLNLDSKDGELSEGLGTRKKGRRTLTERQRTWGGEKAGKTAAGNSGRDFLKTGKWNTPFRVHSTAHCTPTHPKSSWSNNDIVICAKLKKKDKYQNDLYTDYEERERERGLGPSYLEVPVILLGDKEHGAAPLPVGGPVPEDELLGHEEAGRLDAADKLVAGKVDGVLVGKAVQVLGHLNKTRLPL